MFIFTRGHRIIVHEIRENYVIFGLREELNVEAYPNIYTNCQIHSENIMTLP
jgi:hypothetical protein